jgi:hypothetical protein
LLLKDRFRPITDTTGLFQCGASHCATDYLSWMQPIISGSGSSLQAEVLPAGRLETHLGRLDPLARAVTTKVLFAPAPAGWTACFTNDWRGSDMSSIVPMLSLRLGCSALRVTCTPDLGKSQRRRYGARIVQAHRANLNPYRSIAVANDGGRWVDERFGEPLPSEDPSWFTADRKRDRFTAAQLRELVSHFAPSFWDADLWPIESAFLVERVGVLPPAYSSVTRLEVQRDLPTDC